MTYHNFSRIMRKISPNNWSKKSNCTLYLSTNTLQVFASSAGGIAQCTYKQGIPIVGFVHTGHSRDLNLHHLPVWLSQSVSVENHCTRPYGPVWISECEWNRNCMFINCKSCRAIEYCDMGYIRIKVYYTYIFAVSYVC